MAGIFGIAGSSRADRIFPEMHRFAALYPWYETNVSEAHLASCGLPGLGLCVTRGEFTLAFYGEIFNLPSSSTLEDFLFDGLLTRGKEFLADVSGRFQGALWEAQKQKLTLFCDHFATRPLYWTKTRDGFLFAPQIKTLFQSPDVSRKLDQEALVDFFTWGHYLNARTSISGVEVLPPAGFYSWDALSGEVCREKYFTFPEEKYSGTVSETAEAFHASVLEQTGFGSVNSGEPENSTSAQSQTLTLEGLGISLSGGLDARSILGMIPEESLPDVTSVALGVPGSADHRLASQLAKKAGTHHFNYELNTDFLSSYEENLDEMVRLTDGQYLSSSIVIPTLSFYRGKNLRTLLRGHAGELFHLSKAYAFSMTPEDRGWMEEGALSPKVWAFQHLQAYMLDGVEGDLFQEFSRRDCSELARTSLNQAFDEAGGEREGKIWRLYLSQRVFREIPLSMRKFDSHVNVRLPFLNRALAESVFRLPTSLRMGETIQQEILKRWQPDFLKVKNVNTGTYIGASPFRQKLAYFRQRVLAKLNVPGYQPYEKMGLWLRRELKPLVSQLLLEDGLCDRGIFRAETIHEIVKTHNAGQNHTYLILALMILEKQFRFLEI